MKSGLVSISFRELSAEVIIGLVADSGLQGIEWGGDVHVTHGDLETARLVGNMTREAGLQVASYGSYYRFEECDLDADVGGPTMESVLETAVVLGAPAIRVWAGQRGPQDTSDIVWNGIVERAREFAVRASALDIRLDFEFHENTLTETPESTRELINGIDHENARSLWQPPLQMSPELRIEGLKRVKPWVSNLHCNHFGQEPWPNIQPLGDGEPEWIQYLKEFPSSAADRWVLIEHVRDHSPEQFKEDAVSLKNWLSVL